MNILGIVPARGGSKGIPKKNIADVCGRPLIDYSISLGNLLVEQQLINRCIVSTDCEEIALVAKKYKADLPFLRPAEIAGDKSKSIDFIIHALESLEEKYDAILILQPTSPLRTFDDIRLAIKIFQDNDADSLISCYEEEYVNDYVSYQLCDVHTLSPKNLMHNKGTMRQEIKPSFVRNGSIYLTKTKYLLKTKQIISDTPYFIEMKKKHSIDVDTKDDLELLRAFIQYENWNT
jgi:CMP-N,N'-diacetyllegionaminic acid synthase